MKLIQLHDSVKFPDEAYNGLRLRVLLNPSGQVWEDFSAGGFHASAQETALLATFDTLIESTETSDEDRAGYARRKEDLERSIAERVERMGRALVALYGTSEAQEVETDDGPVTLDFRTPETAIATAEDTRLPDELTYWIAQLPSAVIERRREFIRSNLGKSFIGPS